MALAALCAPFVVFGLIQAWDDSPTWDEGIYIAAGATIITRHQITIDIEHPPLAKILAAAPALLARPVIPDVASLHQGREFDYAGTFVEANRQAGKLRRVVFLARLLPLAEAVAVALVLYALAATLFGRAAGLVAAAVWLVNPFFLGLGHVGNMDVPATLTTVVAALLLVRLLRGPTWWRTAGLGLAVGVALLVRSTGFFLAAAMALGAGVAMQRSRPNQLARRRLVLTVAAGSLVAVIAWMSVWVGIRGFSPHPWPAPPASAQQVVIANAASSLPWSARLATAVPWPREYADGIRYLAVVSTPPGPGFLLGRAWDGGRWWYWPGAMLVKLPLTTLLALAAGLIILVGMLRHDRRRRLEVTLALALPTLVLTVFVVTQPRDQGLRYLAPVIALAAVAASPLARIGHALIGRVILAVVLAAQLLALAASHPHSLAWTAPPFRPGYRVEADANLDWNQDFYRLEAWAVGKRPWVAYFGAPSIPLSAVPGARQLLHADAHAVQGWVAVSGSILTTYDRDALSWLRGYCPVGTIGGSFIVYHLPGPPDLRPGPVVPARECPGPDSRRVS